MAVFERGEAVLAKGYGSADLEAGVPATPDTSYPIASVTKHFTAGAVLRLADQGRLSLDDPLSRFFPAARPRIVGIWPPWLVTSVESDLPRVLVDGNVAWQPARTSRTAP